LQAQHTKEVLIYAIEPSAQFHCQRYRYGRGVGAFLVTATAQSLKQLKKAMTKQAIVRHEANNGTSKAIAVVAIILAGSLILRV
jgi:hypothetical protein